jgi:hypothetical protein
MCSRIIRRGRELMAAAGYRNSRGLSIEYLYPTLPQVRIVIIKCAS